MAVTWSASDARRSFQMPKRADIVAVMPGSFTGVKSIGPG